MAPLVKALFFVFCAGLLIRAMIAVNRSEKDELRIAADTPFQDTLRLHHIETYELLHEHLVPRAGGHYSSLFEVYRVISDNNGRYYAYVHFSGQTPSLRSISRERALAASQFY